MGGGEYDSQAISRKIFFWTVVGAVGFAIASYLLTS
jgi:hypothetical protein